MTVLWKKGFTFFGLIDSRINIYYGCKLSWNWKHKNRPFSQAKLYRINCNERTMGEGIEFFWDDIYYIDWCKLPWNCKNKKSPILWNFKFLLCHQRTLFKCQHTWTCSIYGHLLHSDFWKTVWIQNNEAKHKWDSIRVLQYIYLN